MKINYKSIFGALALMLSVSACSSDEEYNWEPGPAVDADCMTVYFEALKDYSYYILPTDSHVIPVTVSRANYAEAASVPLHVVSVPEGVSIPQTVDFEAGQRSVSFDVDATDMPNKTSGKVEVSIDDAYTSIYGAGLTTLELDITVGDWTVVAENVRYKFDSTYSGYFYTDLMMLEGTNIFKFPNFLNSGTDLMFTLGEEYEGSYGKLRDVSPYINFQWYDTDDHESGWYFYDAAKGTWPLMQPVEGAVAIQYACFWGYGYDYFCFNGGKDGWGYFYSFIATLDNGDEPYMTISFSKINLLFDPFASEEE